jgi:hypothetical protein
MFASMPHSSDLGKPCRQKRPDTAHILFHQHEETITLGRN